MTDEAALLAAIRAHPDDDAPRLVYADWLLERGDPRGELIQLQCQQTWSAERWQRVQELLVAHRAGWTAHLPTWAREKASFQRGFVTGLTVPNLDAFFEDARQLMALWPRPELELLPAGSIRLSPDESLVLVARTISETFQTMSPRDIDSAEGEDIFVVLELATRKERYRREFGWWWNDSGGGSGTDRLQAAFRADARAVVFTHRGDVRHEDPIP